MSESDDSKKAILSRRAKFVAAALASVGGAIAACSKPEACLAANSVSNEVRRAPGDDAGGSGSGATSAGASDASDASEPPEDPHPRPCLKVARPPGPCLSVMYLPDAAPEAPAADAAPSPDAPPMVCLSKLAPTPTPPVAPKPCLDVGP